MYYDAAAAFYSPEGILFPVLTVLSGPKYLQKSSRTHSVLSYTASGFIRFPRNSFWVSVSVSSSYHG